MVCVTTDVENTVKASKLGNFRAVIHISKEGKYPHSIKSSNEAVDIAFKVREAIQEARGQYSQIQRVHLFIAGPVGLAMLIGQQLNTFGSIQMYEHVTTTGMTGHYEPSILLNT